MSIKESNINRYCHVIENMPVGLVYFKRIINSSIKTVEYVFFDVNKSFERLMGLKKERLLGKTITDVSADGQISGFDFKGICSKADSAEENIRFEYYSNKLKKWYLIYIFNCETEFFSVVFHDITDTKSRTGKINSLYESAMKFNDTPFLNIDYQWIANELLMLSGATFVLVNIYEKETMRTITRGFAGLSNKIHKAVKMLGYNIIGKAWDVSEADLNVMRSKNLVRLGMLHEFSFGRIPPIMVKVVEKAIKLGDSFGIGISYKGDILGSFIIMMGEGESVESPEIVELFVNQLGIILLRKKAEDEVEKIDQEYRMVFNGSQDAMFLVNVINEKSYFYHMINRSYEMVSGLSSEKVKGLTPIELYGEEIGQQIEGHYIDSINAKASIWYEETYYMFGKQRTWHTILSPIIKDDKVVQIMGSSRDISDHKQWEDELARERQLFKVTIHSIGDALITTDIEGRIVIFNKVAEELTGWNSEEAQGKLLSDVFITINERVNNFPWNPVNERQESENQHIDYKILISRNGVKRIISSNEASIRDERGRVLGVVIVFRDVTAEKQKEEEVRYLGYHDRLTGLYNRAYFEEELERLNNERHLPLGIIMGDSNGLKMVNDAFGHEEGDKLLKRIAEIFVSVCGDHDIIARVGGDEFAVILPSTSLEKVNGIISGIKEACSSGIGVLISPSIALGAAIKEQTSQDIKGVYKLAEDRMYNNKLVESKSIRSSIISSLKKTLEERTHETEAHAHRLKEISMKLGRLMGLYDNELDELSLLAVLHDIGKIAIPDYILGKPTCLSDDEWKIMKNHCEIGYRIAVASPELASIANLILCHHERWDGTGYPQGLKREEIPLFSRVIAVVDAYDAMTNDRPYHTAIPKEDALRELERCSGTQFDPYIVEKVIEVISDNEK